MTLDETRQRLVEATIIDVHKIEEESLRAEKENRIPKIVHFCFLGWNHIPIGYLDRIRHWMEVLPEDWVFVNWTPLNKPIESNLEKWLFDHDKRAFYADVVRCKQVTRYGGVYLDCDVEIHKDLTPLLNRDYIFCKEIIQPYMDGGVFMAKKGNRFLQIISDRYDRTTPEEYKKEPRRFLLGDAWTRALKDEGVRIIYDGIDTFEKFDYHLENPVDNEVYCIDTRFFCNPIRFYQKQLHWVKPNPDAWTSHLFTNSWSY